jgi:hypothetical protein
MKRILLLTLACAVGCAGGIDADDPTLSAAAVAPIPHAIVPLKELVIVHPSVVRDPQRTSNAARGPWSFRWLMEQLSGNHGLDKATYFVEAWLGTFHPGNAPEVPAGLLSDRPGVDDLLARWPKRSDGHIDLDQAPFRLLAITNRLDLGTTFGDFGEGRFVFGLVDPVTKTPLAMTVIFEYRLPGMPSTPKDDVAKRQSWAQRWHALGALPFGEQYNNELAKITSSFAKNGGGSSLHQLRSNEIALAKSPMIAGTPPADAVWQLREWHIGSDGALRPAPVKNTPADRFDGNAELANVILGHAAAIGDGSFDLAASDGARFLGFESHEQFGATRWSFPGSAYQPGVPEPLRNSFAMLTCNGCHNAEVGTLPPLVNGVGFYHITPLLADPAGSADDAGSERMSPFMRDIDVPRRSAFLQKQLEPVAY